MKKRYWLCLLYLVVIGVGLALWTREVVLIVLIMLSPVGFPFILFVASAKRGKRVEGFLKAVFLGIATLGGFAGAGAIGILAKGCADSTDGRPATGELEFGLALLGIFLAAMFICGFVLKDYDPES